MSPRAFTAALKERAKERERREALETRADLRAGVIAAVMANSMKAKHSQAARPQDFFPSLRKDGASEGMSDQQIQVAFQAFARGHNRSVAEA